MSLKEWHLTHDKSQLYFKKIEPGNFERARACPSCTRLNIRASAINVVPVPEPQVLEQSG